MKQSDIKTNFHHLIDEIDNEPLLMKLYDLLIKSRVQKEGELWNQLSQEKKNQSFRVKFCFYLYTKCAVAVQFVSATNRIQRA